MKNFTFSFNNQTVAWTDIFPLFLLIFIEIFLSIDNGLILCNITKTLNQKERKKALFIGIISSVLLRFFLLFSTIYLLKFPIVKAFGGLYLLYIGAKSYQSHKKRKNFINTKFWITIIVIECIDFCFALDSMLAAYSFASIYYPYAILGQKLWLIYIGIIIGMIILRSAVYNFVSVLKKVPFLEKILCLFIILMGVKLIIDASLHYTHMSQTTFKIMDYIFWCLSACVLILGFFSTKSSKNR